MVTPKEKKFLKLPEYPGGNKAFKEFIRQNLRYPAQALEKRVEGTVYVEYEVSDTGKVGSAEVSKGIGFGCDEEAIRLVKMLKYGKVTNRGLRLKSKIKSRIEFRLAEYETKINITYTSKAYSNEPKVGSYNYTINL